MAGSTSVDSRKCPGRLAIWALQPPESELKISGLQEVDDLSAQCNEHISIGALSKLS